MPALSDNDPRKWTYELHTAIKHQILVNYLVPWSMKLGSWRTTLALVDGFAGRGRFPSGEKGSPLLVLDVAQGALAVPGMRAQRIVCHFVELNPDNFKNMEAEVALHPASADPSIYIRLYNTRFSQVSKDIVREIRGNRQPSFFFLDPFGYRDPPMDTLREILVLDQAEVLVNLMFEFANRALSVQGTPELSRTLDDLFGSDRWREFASLEGEERERAFIDLYGGQLKKRGAGYVVRFPMGYDESQRTLYYLVHATKHHKGAILMKDEMVKVSTPGELGYAGTTRHHSRPLFRFDADALPDALLRRFDGRSSTFEDLIIETVEDNSATREPDYRKALKKLRSDGKVTVISVDSSGRGLTGRDVIIFQAPPHVPAESLQQMGLWGSDSR